MNLATVDLLTSQRLDSELPKLRIAEEHDREATWLTLLVHDENDFINSLAEWLEVRLECLNRCACRLDSLDCLADADQ